MIEEKKHYYSNKQLREHYFYKDGKLHGELKTYHEDGKLWCHYHMKDGLKHGEFKIYASSGRKKSHTIYIDNIKLDINPSTLSNEDKLALKLKHNIEFLPDKSS